MARHQYSGNAPKTTLASSIGTADTSFSVAAGGGTGYPDGSVGTFFVVIDRGLSTEEKILVTTRTADTFSPVTRAQDNTAAASHAAGAFVEHVWTAVDANDANAHVFVTTQDDHTQYIKTDGSRAFTGTAQIANATPTNVFSTTAAAGAANTLLRSDSTLAVFDATVPTTSSPGDAAAAGAAGKAARRDHTHGRSDAFATPAVVLGTAAAGGVATSLIRSDATIAAFDATAPTTSAVGDAATTGSVAFAARRDHVHGREGFGTPVATATTGNAAGAATTDARSDHVHLAPGRMGHQKVTTSTSTSGTTELDLGYSVAITEVTGRNYKITLMEPSVRMATNSDTYNINIKRDGTAVLITQWEMDTTATNGPGCLVFLQAGAAGSHTYTASAQRTSGTGSMTLTRGASLPGLLLVEDIGP